MATDQHSPRLRRPLRVATPALLLALALALAALWLHRRATGPVDATAPAMPIPPAVATERQRTDHLLSGYQLVDADRRRFRIPIERAMIAIVDNPDLLVPPPIASSDRAAAELPASAPSTRER